MSKPPSVFDKSFKYTPAVETDIKKTIERARKRIELAKQVQVQNEQEAAQKTVHLRRKHG